MFYDRKIRYLNYYRNGERIKNGGFAKTEIRDDSFKMEIMLKGIPVADRDFVDIILCAAGKEVTLGQIAVKNGCGQFLRRSTVENGIDGTGIDYAELTGIRLPLSRTEEISCKWPEEGNSILVTEPERRKSGKYAEPKGRKPERYTEPEDKKSERYMEQEERKPGRYIEPEDKKSERYMEPEDKKSERYTEPENRKPERYTGPEDRKSERYTEPGDRKPAELTDEEDRGEVSFTASESRKVTEGTKAENRKFTAAENGSMAELSGDAETQDRIGKKKNAGEPETISEAAMEGEENVRETQRHPKPMTLMEDKWLQLAAIYPRIRPFRDGREYLSVSPADFVLLTAESYRAANNSFLLHGYYNYRHLILTRIEKRGEILYYVGVPGNYYDREKQVAVMFGFESFECAEEPAQDGDFGYYMMKVQI